MCAVTRECICAAMGGQLVGHPAITMSSISVTAPPLT